MYLRAVSQFFNDDYVQLNTRYEFSSLLIGSTQMRFWLADNNLRLTDSMTDVMAHASLVNKAGFQALSLVNYLVNVILLLADQWKPF